jgi:hypothetical protein
MRQGLPRMMIALAGVAAFRERAGARRCHAAAGDARMPGRVQTDRARLRMGRSRSSRQPTWMPGLVRRPAEAASFLGTAATAQVVAKPSA